MAIEKSISTGGDIRGEHQEAAAQLARIDRKLEGTTSILAAARSRWTDDGRENTRLLNAAAGNMDALIQARSVMTDALQSAWKVWMDYGQSAVQRWSQRVQTGFQVRTPQEMVKVQAELARQEMDEIIQKSIQVSDLMNKATGDAVRRLTDRTDAAPHNPGRSAVGRPPNAANQQRPAA